MGQVILSIYYFVALVAAYILLGAFKKKSDIGNKIGRVMFVTFFVIFFYSVNFITESYRVMSAANSLSLIALDILVLCFYDYIISFLECEDYYPQIIRSLIIYASILDGLFLLENIFNECSHSYKMVTFGDTTMPLLVPNNLYYYHIAYLGIVVVLISLVIVHKLAIVPKKYRKNYYGVIFGFVLAILSNIIYINHAFDIVFDISIVSYGILGIFMYFNTFYYVEVVNRNTTRNIMLNYVTNPIALFNFQGKMTEVSGQFQADLGHLGIKENMEIYDFLHMLVPNNRFNIKSVFEFDYKFEVNATTKNYQCICSCMKDKKDEVIGYMVVFHDVTDLVTAYDQLEKSVIFDSLTGLYNKQHFYKELEKWDKDISWPVSFCIFNVNSLRQLNRIYGVSYGDCVIKELASGIKNTVKLYNYLAKIDDGDIIMVLEKRDEEKANYICQSVKDFFEEIVFETDVTIEYGVATKTRKDQDLTGILNKAKESMQQKKMLREASASSSLVDSLKQTLSENDYETEEHVERTREMSARLAKAMNLPDAEIAKLELLAVLHDIGKVAVPHDVLLKKGKLTDEEKHIMQQHTVKGYRIAKSSPELGGIAECILCHHEKWDGTGYPNKFKGEEIPLLSRIISAVDSHDVMVHDRPYHKAMPEADAIKELKRCSGSQFDPYVIDAFVKLLEKEELEG